MTNAQQDLHLQKENVNARSKPMALTVSEQVSRMPFYFSCLFFRSHLQGMRAYVSGSEKTQTDYRSCISKPIELHAFKH